MPQTYCDDESVYPARPNRGLVWRQCQNCQMELGWPLSQMSVTYCPYCGEPYRRPSHAAEASARMTTAVLWISGLIIGGSLILLYCVLFT